MLPLWREQLRVVLCPDRVTIVRLGKGFRRAIVSKERIQCEVVPGMPLWFGALNALMKYLSESKPKKTNVTVVLSNHFVRYTLLPWSSAIANAEEEKIFARIHFEKIYGEVAKEWSLRMAEPQFGAPRIVSAVDSELIDGIADIIKKAGLRLTSVQPYLMNAFNSWGGAMNKNDGIFVVVETDKACIAKFSANMCTGLKSFVLKENTSGELSEMLKREVLIGELSATGKLYLHAAEDPALEVGNIGFPLYYKLPLDSKGRPVQSSDAKFGMALSGVA